MKAINGKLTIIDGNKVYWNGAEVKGVEGLTLIGNKNGIVNLSLKLKDGDPQQITDLTNGGVSIRGVA